MVNELNLDAPPPCPSEQEGRPTPIAVTALHPLSWWGIAIILALTFAVYAPTLRYQFVHDDRGQIVENPAVHSWRWVPTYFTGQVWAGVMPDKVGNYYRPLFLLWLRVNDAVFGNQAWGWHLTTILAHVLATLLVYLLAWRIGIDRGVGLLAAMIFGLHPAHIEAVAWISGVTEPLLEILFIASFLAYIESQAALPRALRWKSISLVLFALALLEKETALILPVMLVVYEAIFRAPGEMPLAPGSFLAWCRSTAAKVWPYFLIIALYIPLRIYALKGFSHAVTPLSTADLIFTWPGLIAFWIRHLVCPVGLSTFYNLHSVAHPTVANFALPAIFDLSMGLVLFFYARRSRVEAFLVAWLVLPFVPLLNLRVFVANDFAHDRYLYLPSVALAVIVAMLFKKVCRGAGKWNGLPAPLIVVMVCLATGMSYGVVRESSYFKDNLTFYRYNLTKAPHNPDAESNYGSVLAENGEYGAAIDALLDAITYNPTYWTPTYNLALTYYKIGNMPEAEKYYLRAIQINPNNADQYFYLGMIHFKTGRTGDASALLRQAIAIRPTGYAYHLALGLMLKTRGDMAGALQEFQTELANNPGEPAAAAQANEVDEILKEHRARPH